MKTIKYLSILLFVLVLASCKSQKVRQENSIKGSNANILQLTGMKEDDLKSIDSLVVRMGGKPGEYKLLGDTLLLDLTSIKANGKISKESGRIEFFENYPNDSVIPALLTIEKQLNEGKTQKIPFLEKFERISNVEPLCVVPQDTAVVMALIKEYKHLFPSKAFVYFEPTSNPSLKTVKKTYPAPLDSRYFKDVKNVYKKEWAYIVFNEEGRQKYAELTRSNIGKNIAIMNNDTLLANPLVHCEITVGQVGFTQEDWINLVKKAIQIKLAIDQQ